MNNDPIKQKFLDDISRPCLKARKLEVQHLASDYPIDFTSEEITDQEYKWGEGRAANE